MYADVLTHVQDEQVARHHAWQAHLPFLYPPSPLVCALALRGPSLAPSSLRLSLSTFARSVPCFPRGTLLCCPWLLSVSPRSPAWLLRLPSCPLCAPCTLPSACLFSRLPPFYPFLPAPSLAGCMTPWPARSPFRGPDTSSSSHLAMYAAPPLVGRQW